MNKEIEKIKDCIDSVYGSDCAYYGVDGLAIADALYKAGYRQQELVNANIATPTSKWISVEDRLPAPLYDVLVWDIYGNVDTDFVLYTTGKFTRDDVTHWMPIPEPPKMKGE